MRWIRAAVGLVVLVACIGYLVQLFREGDPVSSLRTLTEGALSDPIGLTVAMVSYGFAFVVRSWAWCAVLPGLRFGQSWAGLHVSLLGNHVLPLRLGEVLRVTSVLRRTDLPTQPVVASAVTLRAGDLVAVVVLASIAAPTLLSRLAGPWMWLVAGVGLVVAGVGLGWSRRLARRGASISFSSPAVVVAVVGSWVLESVVIWIIAGFGGFEISLGEAVAVTSVTMVAQAVAVAPGGLGSYEAAATAALVALGHPAGGAFAIALATHAAKTMYALVVGMVAMAAPAPAYWGRTRLPATPPGRPRRTKPTAAAPVVAFLPAYNEEASIGEVLGRMPRQVAGRALVVIVVDDGSVDRSAARAAGAGAIVVTHPVNRGLGAAMRTGLARAVALGPAAVVYFDADGEYFPEDIEAIAAPILDGTADYVVGSRFAGHIEHMQTRRRLGNRVLTAWVQWLTRRKDLTDGQSGYRAFSPEAAAAAEIVHDYNYAQILTLDLLGKGFGYTEVPVRYTFRSTGTSFIRLGRYLRRVVPAVYRELNTEHRVDLDVVGHFSPGSDQYVTPTTSRSTGTTVGAAARLR